jgi:AAA domain
LLAQPIILSEDKQIMKPLEIHRATKCRAKLRLGMSGPSGSGKTYSALLIAHGLGGRIGMIDTEHGSGDLYADLLPEGYDVLQLTPPFTPARYIEAIHVLEAAGASTIIVDSLSQAWTGEGGSLDRHGKIADRSGNSWQAWRQVTPEHNALVETLLQSPCHVIATMRAKTEYVQEKDERTGRPVVRKIGLAPVMRDGIEYEFTIFMELDSQHMAHIGKDRTRLFDGQIIRPSEETGRELLAWLDSMNNSGINCRSKSRTRKTSMNFTNHLLTPIALPMPCKICRHWMHSPAPKMNARPCSNRKRLNRISMSD